MAYTRKHQDVPPLVAARVGPRAAVEAKVHVVGRVSALEDPVVAVQEVDAVCHAELRAVCAPPRAVRAGASHELGHSRPVIARGLAEAVAEADIALGTASRERRVVPAGGVVGRLAAAGVVACCFGTVPGREHCEEERETPDASWKGHVVESRGEIGSSSTLPPWWLLELSMGSLSETSSRVKKTVDTTPGPRRGYVSPI